MEIQKQVCSKEQSKKLKELGICQDSYFSWCGDEQHRLLDNGKDGIDYGESVFISTTEPFNNIELDYRKDVQSANPFAAAFTVSEMIKMIGKGTVASQKLLDAINERIEKGFPITLAIYDVEFIASKMIELIESGILIIDDCNTRLLNK